MGSDESHFNVSLVVRDSHKTVSTDHNFWRERRAEAELIRGPSAYQPDALPLGQTGSHTCTETLRAFRDRWTPGCPLGGCGWVGGWEWGGGGV